MVALARKLKAAKEAEAARRDAESERLRLEYLAREERFVLDGDRHQLQRLRRELDAVKYRVAEEGEESRRGERRTPPRAADRPAPGAAAAETPLRPPRAPVAVTSPESPSGGGSGGEGSGQVARLLSERAQLVEAGYGSGDELVSAIDRRVGELRGQAV